MEDLLQKRSLLVVKSNSIIQKARFDLTMTEQKIVLMLISMIKQDDTEFKLYKFSIQEFCDICGIDETNGKNYIHIKKTLQTLSDKSIWVNVSEKRQTLVRWIERPYIEEQSGIIEIKLDELMKPYLLQLKEYFTKYCLFYTLAMKSRYSLRIYELLKSYENLKQLEISISELKKMLSAEHYSQWNDFKRNVLDRALLEIEAYSDLKITYELKRAGRKIEKIKFKIFLKEDLDERIKILRNVEKHLSKKRLQDSLDIDYGE